MQKIVINTNVIVSALIGKSYPKEIIFSLVLKKKVIVCISPEVFDEYVNVLNRERFIKYAGFVANAEIVLSRMEELSQKHLPALIIDRIKDDSDNAFLELGVSANIDFLITGNTNDQ